MIRPSVFGNESGISSGFTTRYFADSEEEVSDSRERLRKLAGFNALVSADQVHGTRVEVVREPQHVPVCDALVTDRTDLLLTVVSADCALVLLADLEAGIAGVCHSGWRGTAGRISIKTVSTMANLNARPACIRAYVAPCISASAFEVGEEVAEQFDESVVLRRPEWPRPHVDLKSELLRQLLEAGLGRENIEIDTGCTASETERFYSYRAEGGTVGRMIGFIGRLGNGSAAARENI